MNFREILQSILPISFLINFLKSKNKNYLLCYYQYTKYVIECEVKSMNVNPGNTVLDPLPNINRMLADFFAFFVKAFSNIRNFFAGLSVTPDDGAAE